MRTFISTLFISLGLVLAVAGAPTWAYVIAFGLAPVSQIRWSS